MKILFALDNSVENQIKALELAKKVQGKLTALFVCDLGWNRFLCHDWLLGSDARADFLHWMRGKESEEALDTLDEFKKLAGDFPVEIKRVEGEVRKEIIKEAENGYDMLLISDPFMRGLESVKNPIPFIVKSSPCSVLLLKNDLDN